MLESVRTRHWSVRRDVTQNIVWLVRSPELYGSVEEIHASYEPIYRALAVVPRNKSGLVIDMREARWRNDASFEDATAMHRRRLVEGFARVALLVRTTLGKLQGERLTRAENLGWVAFDDERLALAHALGRAAPLPRLPARLQLGQPGLELVGAADMFAVDEHLGRRPLAADRP